MRVSWVVVLGLAGLGMTTPVAGGEVEDDREHRLRGQIVSTALRAEAVLDEIEKGLEKRVKQRAKRKSRAEKFFGRKMSREDRERILQARA